MPIKIKDPAVYECYDSAKCEYGDSKWQVLLEAFTGEINDLADGTEMSANDILKVTDAILRGVDVELKEERYALKLFHSKDGQDLFASTSYTVGMTELTDPERTISVSKRKEYKSDDEWRKMFMAMPWFDFNAFVKVYED